MTWAPWIAVVGLGIIGLVLVAFLHEAEDEPEVLSASPVPPQEPLSFLSWMEGIEALPYPWVERLEEQLQAAQERMAEHWAAWRRLGRGVEQELRRWLREADLPWHPLEWVGLTLGLMALGVGAGYWIYRLPGFVLFGALAGGALPYLLIRHRRASRRQRLEGQLADVLLLISRTLRSGGSLYTAFEEVATQLPPPISEEFRRVLLELRIGFSLSEALEHMRARVPSEELSLAITAIQINQQVGGNLPEFLEKVAARIHERVHLQNEIRIMTAAYRLSAQILSVLPLILWLVLFPLNRRYMMRFFTSGIAGYALLGLLLFLVLLGLLVVRRMTRVDV